MNQVSKCQRSQKDNQKAKAHPRVRVLGKKREVQCSKLKTESKRGQWTKWSGPSPSWSWIPGKGGKEKGIKYVLTVVVKVTQ